MDHTFGAYAQGKGWRLSQNGKIIVAGGNTCTAGKCHWCWVGSFLPMDRVY